MYKTKFLMILLSFTVIASFSSLSGPPAKAFAEENGTPVQKTIDLNEGFDNSNEASIEPLSLTSEATTSQEAVTAIDHDANFSPSTLQFLKANTGLDGEQWDNIMKLVNKPEQDSLKWTEFYGYAEDIGDNRGYTIGIFGATTGGSNDTGPNGRTYSKLLMLLVELVTLPLQVD